MGVEARGLSEPCMIEADDFFKDKELVETVYQAQGQRHPHNPTRGRAQTPAEIVLRLRVGSKNPEAVSSGRPEKMQTG